MPVFGPDTRATTRPPGPEEAVRRARKQCESGTEAHPRGAMPSTAKDRRRAQKSANTSALIRSRTARSTRSPSRDWYNRWRPSSRAATLKKPMLQEGPGCSMYSPCTPKTFGADHPRLRRLPYTIPGATRNAASKDHRAGQCLTKHALTKPGVQYGYTASARRSHHNLPTRPTPIARAGMSQATSCTGAAAAHLTTRMATWQYTQRAWHGQACRGQSLVSRRGRRGCNIRRATYHHVFTQFVCLCPCTRVR